VGHQGKLDQLTRSGVGQAEKRGLGGEVQPTRADGGPERLAGGGGEGHGVAERLAEVLVVVVTGEGQHGAAGGQEGAKGFLEVADGIAEAVGPGEFREEVAGDEEDIDRLGAAVVGDALDGRPQVVGAIDASESVGQMPVGGVQHSHTAILFSGGVFVDVRSREAAGGRCLTASATAWCNEMDGFALWMSRCAPGELHPVRSAGGVVGDRASSWCPLAFRLAGTTARPWPGCNARACPTRTPTPSSVSGGGP
jgi:hypothetical protein